MIQRNKKYDELLKTSPKLLDGSRNHFDGCWDIPIAKVEMQDNHYEKPPLHCALYISRNAMNYTRTIPQVMRKSLGVAKKNVLLKSDDMKTFRYLNSLIDHNILDNAIADFKRYDEKEETVPSKATINVVI